jgi:acyl carrier protein
MNDSSTSESSVKGSLREFILTTFLPGEDPNELTDDYPLISSGILDSIATLKLILYIEETFGITLEPHEADREHLDTLNQITSLILARKK